MNYSKIIIAAILLLSSTVFSQRKTTEITTENAFLESRNFDANNINFSRITNRGDFNTSTWSALNYGTLNAKRILFDAGLWITGMYNGKIHSARKFYSANYSPGPIINNRPAMDELPNDSLRYRVYKIFKTNDPQNPDLIEWPADLGAPVNQGGDPIFFGDQLLWTVYNTLDTNSVDSSFADNKSLGTLPIEIQQKVYGRAGTDKDYIDLFQNVVFIEWTIINKSNSPIDSAFIGLWCDIDFYNIKSNIPSVDVNRQTGYLWSGVDYSPSLGGVPPAVGFTMLYGPVKQKSDTAAIFKGKVLDDFYNLPLSSFNAIGDDANIDPLYGPPLTVRQVYNSANGFNNAGAIIFNPVTGRPTKFPFGGDPVNGAGWLFPEEEIDNGSGFALFSGSFDLAPSDTQWVMAALVPGHGVDKNESIIKMREKIDSLRAQPYDSLAFGNSPIIITSLDEKFDELPQTLTLHQNYPNPFNPTTRISFEVPDINSDYVKLSVYNILGQELRVLVNKRLQAGVYSVNFDASDLPSGIYIYSLSAGTRKLSKKMLVIK